MSRRTTSLFSCAVVVALALGFGGGFLMKSPNESTLPTPKKPLVTTSVESRPLTETITGIATLATAHTHDIVLSAPADRLGVVSATPIKVGEQANWCSPIIEIAGRPTFLLYGAVPSYRDLMHGDAGEDVKQLQRALKKCQFYPGSIDGEFGKGTSSALAKMYASAGYEVPTRDVEVTISTRTSDLRAVEVVPKDQSIEDEQPSGDSGNALEEGTISGAESDGTQPADTPQDITVTRQVVTLHTSDIVFLPSTGSVSSLAKLGSHLGEEPVLKIAAQGLKTTVAFAPLDRLKLDKGMPVEFSFGNEQFSARLPQLPETPVENTETGKSQYVVTFNVDTPLDSALSGSSGTASIAIGSDVIYPTVVPDSAVHADSDGTFFVQVEAPDTVADSTEESTGSAKLRTTKVPIKIVESLGGYSAVESSDPSFAQGISVVIGE